MSFDLSALKLSVDTSQLDEAITKLNKLQQATSKVEQEVKKQGKASKDSSEEQGKSATKAEKLVDKLKQTYEDLSNEFTRGESAVLRYARSLGVSGQQMQVIIGYLQNIKKLSKDPFDDSIGSVRRIQREYEELTNRTNLLAKGIALTAKQAREYSKLSDEIAGKMQAQKLDPVGKDVAVYSERLAKAQEEYLSYVKRVSDLKKQESPVVQSKSTVATTSPAMDMHVLMYRKQQVELEKLNSAMDSHVAKFYKAEQSKANTVKTVTEQAASDYDQHVKMYVANMNKLEARESKSFNTRLENLRKFNQRTEDSLKQADITGITSAPMARAQGVKSALTRMGIASETELLGNPAAQLEVQRAGTNAAKAWELANRQIKSSREMAFAMRQVPMQITDIVVSLAGGQSPFQVLLQQGGQLKDLFGGVKEAAVALGKGLVDSLVSGFKLLVNPIGLAVGAIGALSVAYYKGATESENMNKAIILLGSNAKLSYQELDTYASTIAGLTNTTKGSASEAFLLIAKNTNLSKEAIAELTVTAINFEKVGGKSVEDFAKTIKSLSDDPLKAAMGLHKEFGFLTKATLDQVEAALKYGDTAKATALIISDYKDQVKTTSELLMENLGSLEKGWLSLKNLAISAWDAMLGIGRDSDKSSALDRQIKAQQEFIERIRAGSEAGNIDVAQQELARLQGLKTKGSTVVSKDAARVREENINTFTPKKERDWVEIVNQAQKDQEAKLRTVEETQRYLQAKAEEIFGKEKKDKAAKPKEQKEFLAPYQMSKDMAGWYMDSLEATWKEDAAIKSINSRMNEQIDLQLLQIENQTKGLALTEEERLVRDQLAKLDAERLRILNDIEMNANLTKDQRDAQTEAAKKRFDSARTEVESATRSMYEQTHSFSAGWDKAFASYTDAAKNAAAFGEQAFSKMADGMTDALMQFVTTGKLSFSNLTQSILTDILRIQLRMQVTQLMGNSSGGGLGGLAGMLGGLFGGSSGGFASSAFSNLGSGLSLSSFPAGGGLAFANGGAFSQQGLHAFANGGVFTNSIVSSPTLFKFANGGKFGLMGEAGPEAVMPLSRDSSGRLGVVANGGSSSGVQVVINNMGTSSTVTEQKETVDSRGNRRIELTIADAVASEQARPGSKLYNSTRNSFGLKPALVGR